jgi:hypothetical protein
MHVVALTDAPHDVIASTLPQDAAGDRANTSSMVDRMRAMRRPGGSYRDVILRLVELEARQRWA